MTLQVHAAFCEELHAGLDLAIAEGRTVLVRLDPQADQSGEPVFDRTMAFLPEDYVLARCYAAGDVYVTPIGGEYLR